MAIPDFIVDLRRKIGTELLWLPLPETQPELRARIDAALSDEVAARFIGP
ncbi:hypothetical protein [Nocardioides sp. NPDC127503]